MIDYHHVLYVPVICFLLIVFLLNFYSQITDTQISHTFLKLIIYVHSIFILLLVVIIVVVGVKGHILKTKLSHCGNVRRHLLWTPANQEVTERATVRARSVGMYACGSC